MGGAIPLAALSHWERAASASNCYAHELLYRYFDTLGSSILAAVITVKPVPISVGTGLLVTLAKAATRPK